MAEKWFVRASTAWPKPGEYIQVLYEGEPTARIGCPGCGQSGILDHEIADDGSVTPSIQCPNDDCGYHETGCVLTGWIPDYGSLVRMSPDTRPETRAEPIVEDHTGRWYPNKMPSGQVVMARTRWPEGSESDYTPYKVVANIGGVIVEGAGLMGLTEARMAARVIADSLAQPTQPDAVEAVTESLRVAFEGVADGDCGQVSALVSQSLYQGAGMDYHEACEWSDVIAASVWREVQRRIDRALTTDEEGEGNG